jgi:hypothetical protein
MMVREAPVLQQTDGPSHFARWVICHWLSMDGARDTYALRYGSQALAFASRNEKS